MGDSPRLCLHCAIQSCYGVCVPGTPSDATTAHGGSPSVASVHITPMLAVDATPAMSYRGETVLVSPVGTPRVAVLRVVSIWEGTMHLLTLNHVPVGLDSYPSVDAAIRHGEHEWGPVSAATRVRAMR